MEDRLDRATRHLPPDYVQIGKLDLIQNKRLLILMNIVGLALVAGFGWLFSSSAFWLHPEARRWFWRLSINNWGELWGFMAALLGVMAVVVALHEAAHGLFFWLFTRSRPKFEFKIIYASASAPGWYLPWRQYLVIGLAPLVLLSLFGILAQWLAPLNWLQVVTLFLVMNASGAVGDLMVFVWLLFQPRSSFALDDATCVMLFAPHTVQK